MTKSILLQRISATAQFILGFFIGICLIVGVTGSLVFVYYRQMSVSPKKPVFPESAESTLNESEVDSATAIEPLESNTSPEEDIAIAPEPEFEPEPEPQLELPPNSYYATVTWPQGLSLRAEPRIDAERVGGIEYNSKILILEASADGKWQLVMLPWNQQKGWVKGGNTKRV